MKNYDGYVLNVLLGVLADIKRRYVEDAITLEKSERLLRTQLDKVGLWYLTVTLPELCKALDQSLALGRLELSELPGSRRISKEDQRPALMWPLWRRIFDESGVILDAPDIQAIRCLRQTLLLAKKLELPCSPTARYAAVKSFMETDERLPTPTLSWGKARLSRNGESPLGNLWQLTFYDWFPDQNPDRDLHALLLTAQRVADGIVSSMGEYDPKEWAFRHGPGVVADARDSYKYEFPTWSDRLEEMFPIAEFGFANFRTWVNAVKSDAIASSEDVAARLITVPKTQKVPRLIAAEPTANQWCQQSIAGFLGNWLRYSALRRVVTLRDQTNNQRAALRGSEDGSLATIDLSEASDRLSCWLAERFFRTNPGLLEHMNACRTAWATNKIDKASPGLVALRKFSTMGSALTFPVQSIVFATLACAAIFHDRKIQGFNSGDAVVALEGVRVFGDDIIVPSENAPTLLRLLEALHFKANTKKTFLEGKFRESCGVDAYGGYNVSPTYLRKMPDRTKPQSVVSAVDTHNNFLMGGWDCAAAVQRMTIQLESNVSIPTGVAGSGELCLWTFGVPDEPRLQNLRVRLNPRTQVFEVYAPRIVSRRKIQSPSSDAGLLQYFAEDPSPKIKWAAGKASRTASLMRRGWVEWSKYLTSNTRVG
jgi:hypothetical protein